MRNEICTMMLLSPNSDALVFVSFAPLSICRRRGREGGWSGACCGHSIRWTYKIKTPVKIEKTIDLKKWLILKRMFFKINFK